MGLILDNDGKSYQDLELNIVIQMRIILFQFQNILSQPVLDVQLTKKVQLRLSKKYDPLKESNFLKQQSVSRQLLNLKNATKYSNLYNTELIQMHDEQVDAEGLN
jgi:hypothetical protein